MPPLDTSWRQGVRGATAAKAAARAPHMTGEQEAALRPVVVRINAVVETQLAPRVVIEAGRIHGLRGALSAQAWRNLGRVRVHAKS